MSESKEEIPGFYRDPKTGKYFREKPGDAGNPSLKKLKEREVDVVVEKSKKPPEITNVLKHLRARELGPIGGVREANEYYKMRTYSKKLTQDISLNTMQTYDIVSVDFIKGGENSVFGMWNIKNNKNRFVVGEQPFMDFSHHENLGFRLCSSYVIDMCEGPDETIVCLYNNPTPQLGCFEYLPRTSPVNFRTFFSNCGSFTKSPLFCCSVGTSGLTYAVGSEGFIRFFNGFCCESTYNVNGRVHTISFDESANLMVSGVHHGALYIHDVRLKRIQTDMRVSNTCLIDSCFLDTQHVIVAGVSNKLFKVDLRVNKIVTEYFQHKHSTRKRPFSIANSMLCATGSDNIIRIWHLSGGNPIHEIKPLAKAGNEIRGWLHGNCNKTHLYYFEGHHKKVFEIV